MLNFALTGFSEDRTGKRRSRIASLCVRFAGSRKESAGYDTDREVKECV